MSRRERDLLRRIQAATFVLPILVVATTGACRKSAVPRDMDATTQAVLDDASADAGDTTVYLLTRPKHAPPEVPVYARISDNGYGYYTATWPGGSRSWKDPCPPLRNASLPENATLQCPEANPMEGYLDLERTKNQRKEDPEACCYKARSQVVRGRMLTTASGAPIVANIGDGARSTLARAWLDDAAEEQAAATAFRRAARELENVGAPEDLVRDTRRAAEDEERHARACEVIASRYGDGNAHVDRIEDMPPRSLDIAGVAITTLVEACIPETIAALVCGYASDGCATSETTIRDALAEIADDESSHAALAFRVVAWALSSVEHRADLASRLVDAFDSACAHLVVTTGVDEEETRLAKVGRLPRIEQERATRAAFEQILRPTLESLVLSTVEQRALSHEVLQGLAQA